ncbi:MAG: Dabb family protein [Moraxellaceae bacterium]|nr:Dabb family protein [Moraxellaceae bacterium]
MVRHIVFWRLNGATEAARAGQAATIKTTLEALNGRIAGLRKLEVGIDFSRGEASADIALYSEFDDRAALDAYQPHPLHLAAVAVVKPLVSERRVADYEL